MQVLGVVGEVGVQEEGEGEGEEGRGEEEEREGEGEVGEGYSPTCPHMYSIFWSTKRGSTLNGPRPLADLFTARLCLGCKAMYQVSHII